jgi:hypothetical protein
MLSSKKLTNKETLRHMFICLRPRTPSPQYTVYVYMYNILIHTEKGEGGRVEPERR